MSAAVSSTPANQDRPLLLPSPLPSDQRGGRMRTLLDLLNVEKMDGLDHRSIIQSDGARGGGSRWRFLKERLGLRIVGCCGVATWRNNFLQFPNDENVAQNEHIIIVNTNHTQEINEENEIATQIATHYQSENRTNLATALAAEREYRPAGETEAPSGNTTPSRVSLMRLLEETTDGGDLTSEPKEEEEVVGSDRVCCVCMGRKKGAAFIPCGHTYCRVCSRELWLNRGSCPLCNQRILEILDIF